MYEVHAFESRRLIYMFLISVSGDSGGISGGGDSGNDVDGTWECK